MTVAWVFVQDGCHYCAELEQLVSSAGLSGVVSFSGSNPCGWGSTPCTKTAEGCFGYPSCDAGCQLTAIRGAYNKSIGNITQPGPGPATPAAPATTVKTAPKTTTAAPTPAWKTASWSNDVVVNWGEPNPKPTIAETPAGYQPPDVQLTPVLPLPPEITTGITIALRDHHRKPKGRKIA